MTGKRYKFTVLSDNERRSALRQAIKNDYQSKSSGHLTSKSSCPILDARMAKPVPIRDREFIWDILHSTENIRRFPEYGKILDEYTDYERNASISGIILDSSIHPNTTSELRAYFNALERSPSNVPLETAIGILVDLKVGQWDMSRLSNEQKKTVKAMLLQLIHLRQKTLATKLYSKSSANRRPFRELTGIERVEQVQEEEGEDARTYFDRLFTGGGDFPERKNTFAFISNVLKLKEANVVKMSLKMFLVCAERKTVDLSNFPITKANLDKLINLERDGQAGSQFNQGSAMVYIILDRCQKDFTSMIVPYALLIERVGGFLIMSENARYVYQAKILDILEVDTTRNNGQFVTILIYSWIESNMIKKVISIVQNDEPFSSYRVFNPNLLGFYLFDDMNESLNIESYVLIKPGTTIVDTSRLYILADPRNSISPSSVRDAMSSSITGGDASIMQIARTKKYR